VRIAIIYIISGFGGNVVCSLFIRSSISVGASGAVFGLLGAMASQVFTNWPLNSKKLKVTSNFSFSVYQFKITFYSSNCVLRFIRQ